MPAFTDTKKGRTDKCERIDNIETLKKRLGNIENLEGDCGKDSVMCNPLVFGVDKSESSGKFKVTCVKASNNATRACDKVAKGTRLENLKSPLASEKNKKLLAKFKNTIQRTCSGNSSSAEAAKTKDKQALAENCKTLQARIDSIPSDIDAAPASNSRQGSLVKSERGAK